MYWEVDFEFLKDKDEDFYEWFQLKHKKLSSSVIRSELTEYILTCYYLVSLLTAVRVFRKIVVV